MNSSRHFHAQVVGFFLVGVFKQSIMQGLLRVLSASHCLLTQGELKTGEMYRGHLMNCEDCRSDADHVPYQQLKAMGSNHQLKAMGSLPSTFLGWFGAAFREGSKKGFQGSPWPLGMSPLCSGQYECYVGRRHSHGQRWQGYQLGAGARWVTGSNFVTTRNWTAGFSPCFHLPGLVSFWGYLILDNHTQMFKTGSGCFFFILGAEVYLRGSQIRYFILPDMLRHAPMFKKKACNSTRRFDRLGMRMDLSN